MNAITENVSIKPKRGRPYLVFTDAADKHEWKKLHPDVRTNRSLMNRMYFWQALSVLGAGHKPEFLWLADAKADRFKRTILTELGRVDDDQELRVLALELCQRKLKTAAAVALIRSRRGVLKPATQLSITRCLQVSINRWRAANPSGTWDQVQEGLTTLALTVEGRRKRHNRQLPYRGRARRRGRLDDRLAFQERSVAGCRPRLSRLWRAGDC